VSLPAVDKLEAEARRRLPDSTVRWLAGGAGEEVTLGDNEAARNQLLLRPRVLVDVGEVRTDTELLGHSLSLPVLLAPTGRQGVLHPDGELASARAALEAGTVFCCPMLSTVDLHELAREELSPRWQQLDVLSDRHHTARVVEAARDAGVDRLVLAVGRSARGHRPRMRDPDVPPGVAIASHLGDEGGSIENGRGIDPSLSWKDVEWVAGFGLPVTIKGVLTGRDATEALEHGADSIIVSNHGARQFDGCISTAAALAEVVTEVGSRVPVLVDRGIRTGTDVVRALAVGASAVLIGRPYLWGLAARGKDGVRMVLEAFAEDLRQVMRLAGVPSLRAVGRDLVIHRAALSLLWAELGGPPRWRAACGEGRRQAARAEPRSWTHS
jgi:4-hydroxymandelate oxidase